MREWLSWWSATLPRSGSRVRVPSRALVNEAETLIFTAFPFFCFVCYLNHFESLRYIFSIRHGYFYDCRYFTDRVYDSHKAITVIKNINACILFSIGMVYNIYKR